MKRYFIHTFWCQMNQADSEKIQMVLLQCWFIKASWIEVADIVIFNTCSVRQKWEDRVFGMIQEIKKNDKQKKEKTLIWITWCMVRKTWLAKKYYYLKNRKKTKKIQLLDTVDGIYNSDDSLLVRSDYIDFVFRIEETKYIPHILSHIFWKKIWQEDKFDDYLKQAQQRENPFSASIIIQTWCDNYCTFCIVPYTRGSEISRDHNAIVMESKQSVDNGAKEITLLGQNVNSYGKQRNSKFWNIRKSKWNYNFQQFKIGIDMDDTLFVILSEDLIKTYNKKFHDTIDMDSVNTFDCWGIKNLMNEYHHYENNNARDLKLHTWAESVIKKLHISWHQLYIITSRKPKDKKNTLILLEKYFWNNFFNKIIFTKELWHDHKYKIANEYNLDIVIDDGPHHIEEYTKNFAWKIIIFHAPWNKQIQEDNKKIFRIYDWYDFENILPKISFVSPFRKLLEDIGNISWLDRIRFTSSNPHDMTQDILDAHFEVPNLCNYLHFALQSWSNEMLKKMNRKHSYEDFRDMVRYLRNKDPLFSISTDIIVGFSGETDEMFEQTVCAFKECEFDFSYTARYSVRPQTLASRIFPDDVPDSIKASRWHTLNSLLLKNIQKRNQLMLWRTEEVLISWIKDDYFFGRTRNFKEVFFEKCDWIYIWDIISIKITDLDRYVLKGKRV